MHDDLHRILIKGGVTSPGELKDSISMLEAAGLDTVFFGSRQDLLFPLGGMHEEQLEKLSRFHTEIVADRSYQNIVCSYVAADIFDMTHWLKGSTYLYLLERFDFQPRLKINITDPRQRLVPLFSGNLNFVASGHEDYWYLNVKLPSWKQAAYYPVLVYSWDITTFCRAIEDIHEDVEDVDEMFGILKTQLATNNKTVDKPLELPYLTFPYYEGMNRMGLDKYWLGLYWRNNNYDLAFLKELCGFCLDNSIGKICITPWKSLIIKGIKQEGRPELERLLGQYGINIRHSQLEMNWHLPVDDTEALELKQFLVRTFDQNDISTYGLTFGISNDPGKRSHFSSVVLEKNTLPQLIREYDIRPTYNVLHYKNFDPNTQIYQVYAQDVDKIELPGLLMELSKKYFKQLGRDSRPDPAVKKEELKQEREVFQCNLCLTVYDPTVGDEKLGVDAGTGFEELPESYYCPVCEAGKSAFEKKSLVFT
jgi:rubredoxin